MWTPRQSEFLKAVTPYVAPVSNVLSAQTLEYRVRPTRFRLEGLLFQFLVTTNAGNAMNCEGLAGLIEEVSVDLNDGMGTGTRQAIKASGPALIEWASNNGWKPDPFTSYGTTDGLTVITSTSYLITVPILFRHPLLQEPKSMLTSIPLYGPHVQEDVVVRVKLRASTAVTATATPFSAGKAFMQALYRQPSATPGLDGYIPTEFREEVFYPSATGEQRYALPPGGYVSGVLLRNHTTNAYSSSQTSQGLVNATTYSAFPSDLTGIMQLKVGKSIRQEFNEATLLAMNHATGRKSARVDLTANSGRDMPSNVFFLDLLADFADTDASSIATVINLNPVSQGGDSAEIVFKDWLNSSYAARIACHKFLPKNPADLNALTFGV